MYRVFLVNKLLINTNVINLTTVHLFEGCYLSCTSGKTRFTKDGFLGIFINNYKVRTLIPWYSMVLSKVVVVLGILRRHTVVFADTLEKMTNN